MKFDGFKTYFVAIFMAVLPFITTQIGSIDWSVVLTNWGVPSDLVVPAAAAVSGVIMIAMRFVTQITTVKTALETPPPTE